MRNKRLDDQCPHTSLPPAKAGVRQCLVPTLSQGDIVVMDNLKPHQSLAC